MINLSPEQCRVIGVMLEKETTTPDQYPLSINALTNGCNQKSNREPVMSLSEYEVQNIVDELVQMNQLMVDHKASGRVNKYFHRFCNTEFGNLKFTTQQRAIMCVLLLRGAQTPGELRTRTNRLADFADVSEVEIALDELQDLNGQTLVKKLAREPGKRESRYVHLFTDLNEKSDASVSDSYVADSYVNDSNASAKSAVDSSADTSAIRPEEHTVYNYAQLTQRVITLEQQVASLTEQVACLIDLLEDK